MTESLTDFDVAKPDVAVAKERFRRLGDVVVDRQTRCVFRDGEAIKLEPRVFALLEYFLEHPGKELSRQELAAHVWNGTNVVDEAIRAVSVLRAALGDTPKQGLHIQTTATGGYRLVSDVQGLNAQNAPGLPAAWPNMAIAAVIGLFIGLAAMAWFNETQTHYAPQAPAVSVEQKPASVAPRAPSP